MRWWPVPQRRMDGVALHIIIFLGVRQTAVLLELESGRIKRVEDPATLDGESSAEDKREALRTLEEVARVMRRVMGPAHPDTLYNQRQLEGYRQRIGGASNL